MIDSIFSSLRRSEWINLCSFAFFIIISWFRPMPVKRRLEVAGFGAAGIGLTLAVAFYSQKVSFSFVTTARDLLPAVLMLFVYWQAGRFFVKPNEWMQKMLLQMDDMLIGPILQHRRSQGARYWFESYLEFAYLLCYPLVPLGIGMLYLIGKEQQVDRYWVIVLSSTYLCYLPLPFIQMLPPRMLLSDADQPPHLPGLRLLNLKILKHASIQVNTFPSAHVASTSAASLALLYFSPAAGAAFLILALSIAGGAVLGRYHYAADVALGITFASIVSLL